MTDWQIVCSFDDIAAWDMTVLGDRLYVGTWQYNAHGQVFEVKLE